MKPQKAAELRAKKGLEDTKLQKLRVKKGFSQNDLAEKSGVTKRTIIAYEHDREKINSARLHTLNKLCEALECKIEDILEDEELIENFNAVK